ncbi:Putative nuclease HARBI1 [Araneus ventricosus]|uniref:Nuclease HARBI1 n=1 Tax=Araneus ventricosus TaxID=182803 RepID=A0A4Y2B020_ARAVE|nr:Putative nuclease HARBI1 [Araneus ventricosus]
MESKRERKVKKRRDLFVELDDYEFRRRFRLTKESVVELTLLIHEKLESKTTLNNALSAVEQVLIALRFYAVASMQLAIADIFEVSQPTVSRVVHRVSEAIASLLPAYIYLPVNKEECKEVSKKFFDIAGFPSVIGALDCTFVRIVSPGGEDAERFRCRKNYFALNVQTIVDSDLVIRNVVARWPGSTHDSTIFNNSAACLTLQSNSLFRNYHLLGDSGYGLEKYLLTPFGNPRSPAEVRYNKSHVLTRNTVERKYGILKRRFPCLSIGLNCHIERVPAIIVACCVLHNLAIRLADPEPPADPQIQDLLRQLELETEQQQLTTSIGSQPRCPAGFAKRNVIVTNYFSN